jgi:hypothetical protein
MFPNWQMAYSRVTVGEQKGPTLVEQVEAMVGPASPDVAAHFMGFARLRGAAA